MASVERAEILTRAVALLKDAETSLAIARDLIIEVEKTGHYSKILDALHERVETESMICQKWLNNEIYDLVVKNTA